ncbi:exonuclease SbcCD subunit D [Aminipila luticellarii]|uniref:Nuclease SbcCD subunit D n=1 Tax=Aminipila luticellarii TaxID=2507160 RepID=A0A410PVI4_9FIRM|nr:exonuclease SbcCD subunit D [Aminipila luticellarii]QAT42947.1 exonuclease SbcCD subunit D [Aminipila luticellarii]
MKLIHLSDLHIGKRVNEFSMLEDQAYILTEIMKQIDEERPDAVIIAGDVYDKSVPPAEAVQLFDDFLVQLSERKPYIFIISGNHDSAERMAFGGRLMKNSRVYISPVFNGSVESIALQDSFGTVSVYMMPFLKPAYVRKYYPDAEISSYNDAVKTVMNRVKVDTSHRNILICHQFVTGAVCCDSEELSVGGLDNVDAGLFDAFDYVALGHLHGPQKIIKETVRYAGTPLKYSFSEVHHKKSMTVVELTEKGRVGVRTRELIPRRDMREIKGSYMEITAREYYKDMNREDYMHITLTDEEDIPDAVGKLRSIYPNIMKLDYDNVRTRSTFSIDRAESAERKSPLEIFEELYKKQNNQPMSGEQRAFSAQLIEKIWEEEL